MRFMTPLVVAGLCLVGCSTEKIIVMPASTVPVSTVRVSTTVDTVDDEEAFLIFVKEETDLEYFFTDSIMVDIAKLVCEALGNGMTGKDIVRMLYETGTSSGLSTEQIVDLGSLSGAGVAAFCPQYESLLKV